MWAEILAIGTELTTGAKLDTNSQWLSQELSQLGIPTLFHTIVADERGANVQALRIAVDRVDLIVVTGGLGPTQDDLTREVLAELAGVELVLHSPSLEVILEMFARRKRTMPERNRIQAMFPVGSEPIPNSRGTAPGIWMEIERSTARPTVVVALPGVPSEMRVMFQEYVVPRLRQRYPSGRVIHRKRLNCFGLGESHAEELLKDLTARGRDPEVGITVHEGTITLRIEAQGESDAECLMKIQSTQVVAQERLTTALFGEEAEELEDIVVRQMLEQGVMIGVVECGTGGLVSQMLNRIPESARCFAGGIVLPATRYSEFDQVATDQDRTTKFAKILGGGADPVAEQQPDVLLCVGAFAEEDPQATTVPEVDLKLEYRGRLHCRQVPLGGDPAITRVRIAKSALNLLRLTLLGVEG